MHHDELVKVGSTEAGGRRPLTLGSHASRKLYCSQPVRPPGQRGAPACPEAGTSRDGALFPDNTSRVMGTSHQPLPPPAPNK